MRELIYILLGVALAGIVVPIFLMLSQGLSHITPKVNISNIPTTNSGASSYPTGNIIGSLIGNLSIGKINYNILTFKIPNKNILNKTVFVVYGPPDSMYGDITYFQVATYSEYRDGSWIIDRSGTYTTRLVSKCPYGTCTTSCYSIRLLIRLDYLPHNGYPFMLKIVSGSGTVLYNKWTNMLKNSGNVREYSICVYVPHVPLYNMFNIPLSEYKSLGETLSKYVQVSPNIRKLLRKYFSNLISDCKTLRCVVYRLLKYIDEHYRYTRYAKIPPGTNPILYILHAKKINCLEANTLLVLTLRSFGIPARLAAGFIGSPYSQYQEIKLYYAHAWSQIYVPGAGWITVDATPGIVKDFLSMLENGETSISGNMDLSRINILNPPNEANIVIGKIKLERPLSGIYELFMTYLDYYASNNTWIREKVRDYSCNELSTLNMLLKNNFISKNIIKYEIHLYIPIRYVPHIDYAIKIRPGTINPSSNEILSEGSMFFKITSLRIGKSDLLNILDIPLSAYANINVPHIFLQIPYSDKNLLSKVAANVTSGCETLLCVLRRVYMFVLDRLNPMTITFTSNPQKYSSVDIIREVLTSSNITLANSREFFTIANTLVVLLLRARGIPARLAIGVTTMLSGEEGIIRGDLVVWPQVYVPVGDGLWVDLPYQPLLAVIEFSRNYYYRNISLTVIRGGSWKCRYIPISIIYSRPIKNINIRGLPRDVYYRLEISNYGKLKICIRAGENAPLGIYSIMIKIPGLYGTDYIYLNLLIKARTRIVIKEIYPTYVSPGSIFMVKGYLVDDKGEPLPNKVIYVYVKTSKRGKIVATCPGKTLPNGTFNIECYIPQREPLGKYYVEAVFNGTLYYVNSSTDPYIYVSPRPIISIHIPASCTMINTISMLCITNSDNVTITIKANPYIIDRIRLYVKGSEYRYIYEKNLLKILLDNVKNSSIILLKYPGSISYSYFNFIISIVRVRISKMLTRCRISNGSYICYRNYTISLKLENKLPELSYEVLTKIIGEGNFTLDKRYLTRENITLLLRNLNPGMYYVTICVRPLIHQGQTIYPAPINVLRDPPYVNIIDYNCVKLLNFSIEVLSLITLKDVSVLYSIPNLLTFHVIIRGKVLDYFSNNPVNSIVCIGNICTHTSNGSFSIVTHISPRLTIFVKPLSKYYSNSQFYVTIPIYVLAIPLIFYSSIGAISGVAIYRLYRFIRRRRKRSVVFYGGTIFSKIRGFIKLLDIREGEPLVWGIHEPLRIEVSAFREGSPVPDNSLIVKVDEFYTGQGRYHEIVFNREGVYEISLYVDNIKVCSVNLKVVNYRSEIGRIFEEVLERVLGENAKYMTPRQIVSKLVEKGIDRSIAERIVNIHEKVTYARQNVNRRIFIEFVTLIKHVDRKYILAGVPQI